MQATLKPDKIQALMSGLNELLNPSKVDSFLACAVGLHDICQGSGPKTSLIHVRFKEDEPQVESLAEFLWSQCMYYALPRKRRIKFEEALKNDFSIVARIHQAVRDVFIELDANNEARASEVGEVLAYCIVQHYLAAPQVAAKMALKTSGNMPVHGLDGIHAVYAENALTVFFIESKISGSAAKGIAEYAKSASNFLANRKQYLREYEIVGDLGNLDSLSGEAREAALEYFDIFEQPQLPRRERYVGVVCHSDSKSYDNKIPVSDGPADAHEKNFAQVLKAKHPSRQAIAGKHIAGQGGNCSKSILFLVSVPNVNKLRRHFYKQMGLQVSDIEELNEGDEV
ncbi:MAG: DUF1837 domain-containing protein [Candidatus Competibacter sp.]|nr:DUF1837 domain-containing protein [Candidatus Competibacter sp.]